MDKQEQPSVIDATRHLLESFSSGGSEDLKNSFKGLKDQILQRLNDDPLRTIGIALTLGFTATKILNSAGGSDLKKKFAQTVGSALVYGLVNPVLKSGLNAENTNLH